LRCNYFFLVLILVFVLPVAGAGSAPPPSEPFPDELPVVANDSGVEISSFYSDFETADITLNASRPIQNVDVVFEMYYRQHLEASKTIHLGNLEPGETMKVISWDFSPRFSIYTAMAEVFVNGTLASRAVYSLAYGSSKLAINIKPGDSGVVLLVTPKTNGIADIEVELLQDMDVIYRKTREGIPIGTTLGQSNEVRFDWPILLEPREYQVRAKVKYHLYDITLTSTHMESFTAKRDVEILRDETDVDDYGVSLVMKGKSMVPFRGEVVAVVQRWGTNETRIFRASPDEILIAGEEDTVGIVWQGLTPGDYQVELMVKDLDGEVLDRYETGLRIPEQPAIQTTPPPKSTPSAGVLAGMLSLLGAFLFLRKHV